MWCFTTAKAEFKFRFPCLPPELRDLIWQHTLPPPRLFHADGLHEANAITPRIRRLYQLCFGANDLDAFQPSNIRAIGFHLRRPPPIATQVCRESRSAVRRADFFLLPVLATGWDVAKDPGMVEISVAWFGGATDILYHSPHCSLFIDNCEGDPELYLPNLERIRNMGMQWCALVQGLPFLWQNPSLNAEELWRRQILALDDYSPGLETVYLVLPMPPASLWTTGPLSCGPSPRGAPLCPRCCYRTRFLSCTSFTPGDTSSGHYGRPSTHLGARIISPRTWCEPLGETYAIRQSLGGSISKRGKGLLSRLADSCMPGAGWRRKVTRPNAGYMVLFSL